MPERKEFVRCSLCGKKLIVRTDGGLFHFAFGKVLNENGEMIMVDYGDGRERPLPAVEMLIHGIVRMRCISKECRASNPEHWNELTFFKTENHRNTPTRREEKNTQGGN